MEKSRRITVSVGEILYWLFWGALLFAKGIGLYDGQTVFKLVLVFAGLCFLLKFSVETYTITEILKIIAVIGLTGLTYVVSGEKGMLLYGLMMVGMKYVDTRRLFAVGTILWTLAFLGLTISSLFHMEDTIYKVHTKLGLGHIFRWGLGYSHPNVLHVSYIVLAMFIIYILGERFRIKHAVYLFIGNCIVFLYSVSYTGFLVFMCLLAGRMYLFVRKKLNKAEKIILQLVFPLCVTVSLIFPLIATGKVFDIVNKILNTRLALAKYYLVPEFISLFGTRVSEITTSTLTMDNAYLFAFITYGIVPFAILCLATVWMIYRLLKEDKYLEVLITLIIAIGGLTEPFLYNTSFKNLSFLFLGAMLFEKKAEKKEYALVPIKAVQSLNMNMAFEFKRLSKVKEKLRYVCIFSSTKLIGGIVGAIFAFLVVSISVSYPEGYVVYRADCADVSEEMNYYDEEVEYTGYKEMADFQQGDLIESFSGNIVKMEKLRGKAAGMILGYCIGYLLCGTWQCFRKERMNR
ncbi:MAG: hypothetical protein ACI4SE_05020 [Lachnospiraceae bacterium]